MLGIQSFDFTVVMLYHFRASVHNDIFRAVRDKKKKSNISQQLSDLVFYSQSVSFPGLENKYGPKDYHKMSSFMEKKAEALSKSSAPVCCLSSFAHCIFILTSKFASVEALQAWHALNSLL